MRRTMMPLLFAIACSNPQPLAIENRTGSNMPLVVEDEHSLYERLGGKDAITAIVDDFVGRIAADTRINAYFANADVPRLKQLLVDQMCEASGGPCKYTGKDMRTAHAGMNIRGADFEAFLRNLDASLVHFKVHDRDRREVLATFAVMKADVTTTP